MTTKNLLQIVQDAADLLGVARPSSVINSTDQQIRQLLGFTLKEGQELSEATEWEELTVEHTFVTVGAQTQTNTPIPSDFDRFVPESLWNRTAKRQLIGPRSSREWQLDQAQSAASTVYQSFRVRGGAFLMYPVPTAGETIAYEYVTKNWAESSSGNGKERFTSDDDVFRLDAELMIQGVIWRWKHAKGLDYGEDFVTYERAVAMAIAADGGAEDLDIGRPNRLDRIYNIPEGGFPS